MVKTEQKIQSEPSKPIPSSTSTSPSPSSSCSKKKKYKGVRMRSWGSWVSEIRAPNQKTRIWLGSYSTAEAAARAYDAALLCLKGSSANLNFPLTFSAHYIPDNTAMSPKSIQRVAAAAAAAASTNNSFAETPTTTPPISPPLPSSSSSSSSSSSIPSPSPSEQIDQDVSLTGSFGNYNDLSMMEEPLSWFNFDASDQMFSAVSFDQPPVLDDFWEDGDIRLWSFC